MKLEEFNVRKIKTVEIRSGNSVGLKIYFFKDDGDFSLDTITFWGYEGKMVKIEKLKGEVKDDQK